MSALFDPHALERRFEPMDRLDRKLWLPAIVNTQGHPVARLAGLAAARARLLEGRTAFVPGEDWPQADIASAFEAQFERLGLHLLARGREELADQVLRSMLWHVDRIARLSGSAGRPEAIARCAAAFADDWEARSEEIREVLRVIESLDGVANFARWSEVRGLLQSQAWQHVVAARERIARLPKLAEMIRRMGRSRAAEDRVPLPEAAAAPAQSPPTRVRQEREVELVGAPLEAEGIRRSGEFDRMLAVEAMQLRRRRRLFVARLAERALLTYRHRQAMTETAWVRSAGAPRGDTERLQPRLQAGPMILCVDTSASMSGAPERVAKAVVLEAMRVAAAEHRPCRLFAFSGPGDLAELDLSRPMDGLIDVAAFLSGSFHGGTDVCEPFERALDTLAQGQWHRADLLIASDGEFGVPPALLARLDSARRCFGLRVQGVLVGDRDTPGMRQVCDEVFRVADWRRFGAGEAQSRTLGAAQSPRAGEAVS